MKKIFIILLILGFIVALVVPILREKSSETEIGFTFELQDNLAIKLGQSLPINIEVIDDVNEISLEINGEIVKTWNAPSRKISHELNTTGLNVGSYEIVLTATMENGMIQTEQRLLRVLSDIIPEKWTVEIVQDYPHLESSFTQGLEFDGNALFEGTGDPNQSGNTMVSEVDLMTGEIKRKSGLDASYFGEGISIFDNELFQLTWKNGKCFVYDKNNLSLIRELKYTGEGWGLCHDDKNLIMSDGSERIYFRNPKTFEIIRTIEVYSDQGPLNYLNELEYIDGKIYANIWTSTNIAVIDPQNGKVLALIDATNVVREGKGNGEVLNGIAWNKLNKKTYLTGKYWPKLFEVKLNKRPA
jgi:glutaminyl-peptide cyclotransferase